MFRSGTETHQQQQQARKTRATLEALKVASFLGIIIRQQRITSAGLESAGM